MSDQPVPLIDQSPATNPQSLRIIAWAIFLATSWTWCIGMYLPVLLLRELGFWGFVIFAVPNVIGAASLGWVFRNQQANRRMVERHETACISFSLVTIAFHAFFAAWIIRRLIGPNAGVAVAAAFWVYWVILQWKSGGKILAACLTLLISIAVIVWGLANNQISLSPSFAATKPASMDLLGWSVACGFGLLLCPYLDLTFHDARDSLTAPQARAAFSIGFGVFFLAMIVFTVGYSNWLVTAFDRTRYPLLGQVLATYMIAHSCFTVAIHSQQIARHARQIRVRRFISFAISLAAVVLLGVFARERFSYRGRSMGEIVYLCFLGFYALVFPAYVWLRVIPPHRSPLRVATTVLIAFPLLWMGFIEHQMICILPALFIVLCAKAFK